MRTKANPKIIVSEYKNAMLFERVFVKKASW